MQRSLMLVDSVRLNLRFLFDSLACDSALLLTVGFTGCSLVCLELLNHTFVVYENVLAKKPNIS